jgi:RHS repeat-associated protein
MFSNRENQPPPAALQSALHTYDGDGHGLCTPGPRSGERGNLVKSVVNGTTTYYPSTTYQEEISGNTTKVTKYYNLGGQKVAMRTSTGGSSTLSWLITDHLGSTNVTANADGSLQSEMRYAPFGEMRYTNGVTPSDYRYTGQRNLDAQGNTFSLGLMDYNARFYDPLLGRFIQPDTIVPGAGSSAAFNRFSYVFNNPIRFNDPSGHLICEDSFYGCSRNFTSTYRVNPGSLSYWIWAIRSEYGVSLKAGTNYKVYKRNDDDNSYQLDSNGNKIFDHNEIGRNWNISNAKSVAYSLGLSSLAGMGDAKGATFYLYENFQGAGHYSGWTTGSNQINFYTTGTIPIQNVLHETGHLIDNRCGDCFSRRLEDNPHNSSDGNYLWGGRGLGIINSKEVIKNPSVENWTNPFIVDAIQHPSDDPGEQWADIYANYVIGNIKDQYLLSFLNGAGR